MLSAQTLRGVWATVLLDVTEAGDIAMAAIARQVGASAAAGVDGVYCHGTATEVHSLTDAQALDVARETVRAAREAGLPVQVGATHPLAQGTLERIDAFAPLVPDAIQVTLPDWVPIDTATAIRFLQGCAARARGVPLVLYNPPHAKTVLTPAELADVVAAVPELIGLKTGAGDADWYAAMAPLLARLSVFVPGHFYASGLAQGAHGSYSNIACLSPAGAVGWARMVAADPAGALALEQRITAFRDAALAPMLASGLPGLACDKAMAAAGGWAGIGARLLWPASGASAADIARIRAEAERHIPELLPGGGLG
ncbi:MAG: dihydrodipicolinate synthase family protein [Tropicimonas sp.]|uniref:dihydrodipicolinate synthase family protein n=1 Tax=Tropicimonas sp. TaxID=2067044 RepID=UPI003A8A77CD